MPDVVQQLEDWRQSVLKDWTDHRVVSALWVDTHIWFFQHIYADLANYDLTLDGWSVREKDRGTLLVLKVTQDDTPYVVFLSSTDATHCMRKARDDLRDGGLKLIPDRFRGN